MLDKVVFDGLVAGSSTNWSKHKTSIRVSGDYTASPEIESQSIAQFQKTDATVNVKISTSDVEFIEFAAYITTVQTDWIQSKTKVTFTTTGDKKFEGRLNVLGTWAEKEVKVTISIEPNQKPLL
jgi:hypothetical protein